MSRLLKKSYRRTSSYTLGGIVAAIAINTLENGLNTLAVQRSADGKTVTGITLRADITAKPHFMEFEPGSASFSQPTQIGANRYPKPAIGFKLGGYSDELSELLETLDLEKTTWVIKTQMGHYLLVGEKNGLQSEKTEGGFGATNDDLAGADLTLSGAELKRAPMLTEAIWEALVALVPADAGGDAPDQGA